MLAQHYITPDEKKIKIQDKAEYLNSVLGNNIASLVTRHHKKIIIPLCRPLKSRKSIVLSFSIKRLCKFEIGSSVETDLH